MNEERKELVRKLMGDIDRAAHELKHTENEAEIAEKCEQLKIMATSVLRTRNPPILQSAMRQFRHNHREGVIIGYDAYETDRIVDGLAEEIKRLEMAATTKYYLFSNGYHGCGPGDLYCISDSYDEFLAGSQKLSSDGHIIWALRLSSDGAKKGNYNEESKQIEWSDITLGDMS